jgi:hypothetical protein
MKFRNLINWYGDIVPYDVCGVGRSFYLHSVMLWHIENESRVDKKQNRDDEKNEAIFQFMQEKISSHWPSPRAIATSGS